MDAQIRVLIADDHALVREGTRELLARETDLEVVGEAADGAEAIELAGRLLPDVVVIDIGMPGINGVEATARIKAEHPEVGVLVLTVQDDEQYVYAILEAGAAGYLLKDIHGSQLVEAVRSVRAGEGVLHPAIAKKILGRFRRSDGSVEEVRSLTDRELDVLRLAARGKSNKEIARELDLSARTVQVHLGRIFKKLRVASRTEAVIHGLRRGWFRLEDLS
ncbi:MAG: DNA-binding response regulator [Actinobacteria bacterium RBG_19FT_COMBO_70_19]|nr:MAG: DNA-binding response regulator [Actinobacteria bacterium RBG_19FT_COMBO_70_19]